MNCTKTMSTERVGSCAAAPVVEDVDKTSRRLAFMRGLRKLTRKHGISIGGCGCCGSPWLDESADVIDERAGYSLINGALRWIAPSDSYNWPRYSDDIV